MLKSKEWLTREEIQKRYSYSLYSLNLAIASGKVRKETNKKGKVTYNINDLLSLLGSNGKDLETIMNSMITSRRQKESKNS